MSLQIKGKITKILDTESGTSKAGKDWQKKLFLVETEETYNNLYCFELFNAEKIEEFERSSNVGASVNVSFNVNVREYKGKYYTSLSAWKIDNEDQSTHEEIPPSNEPEDSAADPLPF